MFDQELHEEYLFCRYLASLLPADKIDFFDLEGKLKLEYYKLSETFRGSIQLDEIDGVYEPAKEKSAKGLDEKKPLDEIIEKINERYKGDFKESDKVLINALLPKLVGDSKLKNMAKTSDPKIFKESIFSKAFSDVAMEGYMES